MAKAKANVVDLSNPPKPRVRNDIKGTGQDWRKGKTKYEAEQIKQFCTEYFQYCIDKERKPTIEGLAIHMDITSETLLIWMNADNSDGKEIYNPHVSEVLKKARDYLTDNLQQRSDAMAVFSLKQPRYGGYSDKQQIDSNNKTEILFKVAAIGEK